MEDSKGVQSNTRVFLENLPNGVRKDEIGKAFFSFGDIAKIYLMYDDLGSGFVEFFDTQDASYAADQMSGANFRGNRLKTRLTQGGMARGRGNFESGSRARGRGYSSNYGDRSGSSRFESSSHGYNEGSSYRSRRGSFPRRGRGGRDRFEYSRGSSSFSGRPRRVDRDWEYSDNNDREQSFRGRRFSSRSDRDDYSGRGQRDYYDKEYEFGGDARKSSSYTKSEYNTRESGEYSQSSYKRMNYQGGNRDGRQRDFYESSQFKKGYGRSAEEMDIMDGVKPSKYVKKMYRDDHFDNYDQSAAEKYSYRKPKHDKPVVVDSDSEDYHNLRDRSRSPMRRQKTEHFPTSYDHKEISYVTEGGMHRSHRSKHSEKPMREQKDFVSSHRRHRSREDADHY